MSIKLNTEQMIALLGGPAKVARLTDVTLQAVCQWRDSTIPAGKLVMLGALLEKESHGLVTRKDLFPRNWKLIWPELE